jgi:hypothetical protein
MMTAAALGVAFFALGAVAALPTRRCPRLDQAPEPAHTAPDWAESQRDTRPRPAPRTVLTLGFQAAAKDVWSWSIASRRSG